MSTCCRRLESVTKLRGRCAPVFTSKSKPPVFGLVTERPSNHLQQARERNFLRLHRDGAGFDLGKVQDVADQIEQIGSRPVDGAGKFYLLRGEIASRIFTELLPQNQDAIQRRAQFMRHVRQELRFVFGGQRQLLGLALKRAARLLNLLVLAFHLDILLSQLLRLLRQLFVRLLQLFLLSLQLSGQLLRLFQQPFGLHRCLDAVEHDADAGRQLFKKRELRSGECAERGQLDDRLHAVLKEDRKNDYIARGCFKQAGSDGDGVRRHIGDHHPPFFGSALPNQSFAYPQPAQMDIVVRHRQRRKAAPWPPLLRCASGR